MDLVREEIVQYTLDHTSPVGSTGERVVAATMRDTPMPFLMSGQVESRVLEMLVVASEAQTALEIGTFTGHGALAMASAMPAGGKVITVEYNGDLAALARANIEASPYAGQIELIVGDAREAIERLPGPFDVVFMDAWKRDYIHYYEAVLPKLSPRGVIVADNVLWHGQVLDPASQQDEESQAVVAFNAHVQADPRTTNTILSVADGLLLAWRAPGQS
jgi:caffeoyl-CoA O-methyltransferase